MKHSRTDSAASGQVIACRSEVRKRLIPAVRIVLSVAFAAAVAGNAPANEAFVRVAGGAASLRDPDETAVSLRYETVDIHLYEDHYVVDAVFVFFNPADAVRHDVGFPRFSVTTEEDIPFTDFRTWVNDEPVDFEEIPAASNTPEIHSFYVKSVEFPAHQKTTTRVRYRSDYGRDRLARTVRYLYGTGGTWAGVIDSVTIRVKNHADLWIDGYELPTHETPAHITRSAAAFDLVALDVVPEPEDTFDLTMERVPWWLADPVSAEVVDDWIYDTIRVKEDYLKLLTLEQLRIFRNTFFARNGFDFCDGPLGRYFRRFRWYDPHATDATGLLNEMEKANVRRIQAEEERRRTFLH